jgi:hypothetical protein
VGGTYAGVILLPEAKSHVRLVPTAPRQLRSLTTGADAHPLTIPFDGVYWFLRAPDVQPPAQSFVARGRPENFTFRSTDRRPLIMSAYQSLGMSVSLLCCRAIRLEVVNGDRYPGSVTVEVALVDTQAKGSATLALGGQPILASRSRFPGRIYTPAVRETLTYAIPSSFAGRVFDQIAVTFKLGLVRSDRSARIGIERFVFVPHGL